MTDIVAAFQRNAANSALASDGGGGGGLTIRRGAAQGFSAHGGLANYSVVEQLALVNERHPLGSQEPGPVDSRDPL